ncbi:MAG TPA: hypothetical protein VE972_15085 [Conexibacter sp.]|nr:hypothetical protein [Conexibacter sp.]
MDRSFEEARRQAASLAQQIGRATERTEQLAKALASTVKPARELARINAGGGAHDQSGGGGSFLSAFSSLTGGLSGLAEHAPSGSRFAKLAPALGRLSAGLQVGTGVAQIISSTVHGPIGGSLSAAAMGAGIGMAAGPWGALGGAVVGGGLGALGHGDPAAGIKKVASVVAEGASRAKAAVRDWARANGVDLHKVEQAFHNVASVVRTTFTAAFKAAQAIVKSVMPGIRMIVQGSLQRIAGVVQIFSGLLTGDFTQVWNGIKNIVGGTLKQIIGLAKAMTGPFRTVFLGVFRKAVDGFVGIAGDLLAKFTSFGRSIVSSIVDGIKSGAGAIKSAIDSVIPDVTPWHGLLPWRAGGRVARYAHGGRVPALVSPGEQILHGGMSWIVPGKREPRDSVLTMLPLGAAVLTDHGQALVAAGASVTQALALQAPHFARGGRAGHPKPKPKRPRGSAQDAASKLYAKLDAELALDDLALDQGDPAQGEAALAAKRSDLETYRSQLSRDLERAKSKHDYEAIQDLAGRLQSVGQSLDDLNQSTQAQQQLMQQRMDLDRELADNQKRMLAVAESQPNVLLGGLIAAVNGGIGGKVGLGVQTPAFAGQGVRY